MTGTNLSTRPFYNERLVRLLLTAITLVVAGVTVFNAFTFVRLSHSDEQLNHGAAVDEAGARRARSEAERLRRTLDSAEMAAAAAAATEANGLIDRRTFSWMSLLSSFESSLPADVRIQSISPSIDRDGQLNVAFVVVGRTAEDIDQFAVKLEATGELADLVVRQEMVNQEGLLESLLVGRYVGAGRQVLRSRGAAE
jgi:hypothetical protein